MNPDFRKTQIANTGRLVNAVGRHRDAGASRARERVRGTGALHFVMNREGVFQAPSLAG
jgi:hypothetical protein